MSRKKQIDSEEYKNLYASGMSFNKMAKHFGCGVSTIQNIRLRLNLPIRERIYDHKEIDEKKFLELWGEGKTYREIGYELGITPNNVMHMRLRLSLPDRDITLMKLDTEKFKDMYLTGDSYEKIANEFHITDRTVQEIRNKLHLLKRQPTSTYTEKQFIEACNEGLTYLQLRKKFHISGKVVSIHIKELGLSKQERKQKQEAPVISIPQKLAKPESVEDKQTKSIFIVPTLAEIRKIQLKEKMARIEREQKTFKRGHGHKPDEQLVD
jgi:DNA-binding CsgD family transcriptional regulator